MASVVFALPVLEGRKSLIEQAVASTTGDLQTLHDASVAEKGIDRFTIWFQAAPPTDLLIFYFEAADPQTSLRLLAESDAPLDIFVKDTIRYACGYELGRGKPAPASQVVMDWPPVPR
ncbi:MAG: hypothetical protein M3290_08880 [Actinomycetota bacterium]|nr:hypothetical protein [Actinomycetota bacterium]